MTEYTEYPGLAGVYLEGSYVLSIDQDSQRMTFRLDAVLTPQSPAYRAPGPDEKYCFARGDLSFTDVIDVEWLERSDHRYSDATGEQDLGGFDSLRPEGDVYLIEGDFGRARIRAAQRPRFDLTE